MTDTDHAVLRRVRKLLALAGRAGTEGEAAAAAAAAASLMERYGLREAEVAAAGGAERAVEPIRWSMLEVEGAARGRREAYQETLLRGLSAAFACRFYMRRGTGPVYGLCGRASAVESGAYVFSLLIREIERFAERAAIRVLAEDKHGVGRAWMRSYRIGAASTICERLLAERRKIVADRRAQRHAAQAAPAEPAGPGEAIPADRALAVRARALDLIDQDEARVEREYQSQIGRDAGALGASRSLDGYDRGKRDGAAIQWSSARGGLGAGQGRLPGGE